jgi:hypothetical protein
MTSEVGCGARAGRLRKLRTPASGRLVGSERHIGRTSLGPAATQVGRVIAGPGHNGEDGTEGVRCREIYATCLHGPVLPENPWLAGHLISRALRHSNGDMWPSDSLAPSADHAEAEAHAAALGLACRPARRSGAAAATGSRRRRPGPGQAGRDGMAECGAQPASRGTGWNSR